MNREVGKIIVIMLIAIIGLAAIMSEKTTVNDENRTISEVVLSEERFADFRDLMEAAGLTQELNEGGPYTIFVPNSDAFNELPAEILDGVLGNETRALSVLEYHIVEGNLTQENLLEIYREEEIINLGNDVLVIDENEEGEVLVNGEIIIEPDVLTANGVLHIISGVLLPPANGTSNEE